MLNPELEEHDTRIEQLEDAVQELQTASLVMSTTIKRVLQRFDGHASYLERNDDGEYTGATFSDIFARTFGEVYKELVGEGETEGV